MAKGGVNKMLIISPTFLCVTGKGVPFLFLRKSMHSWKQNENYKKKLGIVCFGNMILMTKKYMKKDDDSDMLTIRDEIRFCSF